MTMSRKTFTTMALTMGLFASLGVDLRAQAAEDDGWLSGTLVVLSGEANEALLIDAQTRAVVGRFDTGPDPREVAVSPDGRYAYVTSYGWTPAPGTRPDEMLDAAPGSRGVTVLDLMQRRVHAVFQPREYLGLEDVKVSDDGSRVWMTSHEDGIVELDAHTGEVKMLWKTSGADPATLTVTRDNRRIWVSNTGSDLVTMIDRVTVVPNDVPTGRRPQGLALSPNESEVWVANSAENTISVISARRLKEEARFPSGGVGPTRLAFNPQGNQVWISHRGTQEVVVLDIASAAILARIPMAGEPRSIEFSDDGVRAFVSVPTLHRVEVIDVASHKVEESISAGRQPTDIAWSDHGRSSRDR